MRTALKTEVIWLGCDLVELLQAQDSNLASTRGCTRGVFEI